MSVKLMSSKELTEKQKEREKMKADKVLDAKGLSCPMPR